MSFYSEFESLSLERSTTFTTKTKTWYRVLKLSFLRQQNSVKDFNRVFSIMINSNGVYNQ